MLKNFAHFLPSNYNNIPKVKLLQILRQHKVNINLDFITFHIFLTSCKQQLQSKIKIEERYFLFHVI